jgi:SAM-dependent methyltransferase
MSKHKELNIQQWSAHGAAYATSTIHAQGRSLTRLIEITEPEPSWVVLDVSTGAGHTALIYASRVQRIIATDLTLGMLMVSKVMLDGRGIPNVELANSDAEALPFGHSVFDLITNRLGLHHYFDAPRAIEEMARVLKLGGILALVDNVLPEDEELAQFVNAFDKLRDPSHHRAYSLTELKDLLIQAGLKLEYHETAEKKLDFDFWVERMGCSTKTREKLLQLLHHAPTLVTEFLRPHFEKDRLVFSFMETILIAKK